MATTPTQPRHIPDDIWTNVAQFLPPRKLEDLFTVNRAFLYSSLNVRYHTIHLSRLDMGTFMLLMRLQDERLAKRVRVFHIQPLSMRMVEDELEDSDSENHFVASERQLMQSFVEDIRKRIPDTVELDFDWSNPVQEINRCITNAVAHMPNVKNCTWVFLDYFPSFKLPTNFSANWPAFSNNLEVLELLNPITDAACGLQSAHFPCLRELSLAMADWTVRSMHGAEEPPALDILASFVSRLKPTLKRLTIQSEWPTGRWFDKLGHFPQLISLDLSMTVLLDEGGISRFIAKHAATLEHLAFENSVFHPRFAFMEEEFDALEATQQNVLRIFSFSVPFPRLRKLELDLEHMENGMALATCIPPFLNTLPTLVLKRSISKGDLDIISDAIARNPGALTSVSLDIDCLTPQIVDLLAERFPNFTNLTLTVQGISGEARTFTPFSDMVFCQEMEGKEYPQWRLREITLLFKHGCGRTTPCWKTMAFLAKSVPSIKSFNGRGNLTIPAGRADRFVEEEIKATCPRCAGNPDS